MFQPPEARTAMGFPLTYKLPPTKREALILMGNAVCPPVVEDLFKRLGLLPSLRYSNMDSR